MQNRLLAADEANSKAERQKRLALLAHSAAMDCTENELKVCSFKASRIVKRRGELAGQVLGPSTFRPERSEAAVSTPASSSNLSRREVQ